MKKFNYIDIIIILLAIVIAVVGAFTITALRDEKGGAGLSALINQDKTVVYEILFEEVEQFLVDELKNQNEIYAVDANEFIGNVVSYRVEPYVETEVNKTTGEVYNLEKPEAYNVYLKVEAKAKMLNNGSFKVGVAELFPTKQLNLSGKHFYSVAKIWEIIEVK